LPFHRRRLGDGENLFAGLDLPKLGYERTEHVPSALCHARGVQQARGVVRLLEARC